MSKQHTFCSLHPAVQYRFTVAAATTAAQGEQVSTKISGYLLIVILGPYEKNTVRLYHF